VRFTDYYTYIFQMYLRSQQRIFVVIFFCFFTTCFCPYGPSSSEIQEHNLYFESAIDTTTDPLFYNCSLIGVSLLLSIYNSYNGN
jgi:hypothetical protein